MTHTYPTKNGDLKINLDIKKNHAIILHNGIQIGIIDTNKDLKNGKQFNINNNTLLYIKLINLTEGFTVMINNIHHEKSAGHPKKLIRKTRIAAILTFILFLIQLSYVIFDVYHKGELNTVVSVKTISYISYFLVLPIITLYSILSIKKGNWTAPLIAVILLLINTIFTYTVSAFYGTGINMITWLLLFAHVLLLVTFYSKSAIIKYVRDYKRSLGF